MKPLIVTPRQAELLDALCELGETDLVARKMNITMVMVGRHIYRIMKANKYPNRLTLALAWDRQKRKT